MTAAGRRWQGESPRAPQPRPVDARRVDKACDKVALGDLRMAENSGTLRISPAGTPAAFSMAAQSAAERCASACSISAFSAARLASLFSRWLKRESAARSGRPIEPAQRFELLLPVGCDIEEAVAGGKGA